MRAIYGRARDLATSRTAVDTYILFSGNLANSVIGFIFTWIIARSLSVGDFGIFSAVNNLVYIIIPLTDLGTTTAVVRFVAEHDAKGEERKSLQFVKAAFNFKLILFIIISIIIFIFSEPIAQRLLASNNPQTSYWVVLISLGIFMPSFIPAILTAKKKFFRSAFVDVSYALGRVIFVVPFLIGGLTLIESFKAFALAGVGSLLVISLVYGYRFLKATSPSKVYKELLVFSGWLGVNKVISSIASRADVQMLALLATATSIGYYSIAIKLAFFISFLAASFSAVIAPRLSSFNNKEAEFTYIKKALLAMIPFCFGIIFWAIVARPFIAVFGEQYLPAVGVFRVLLLSMIPFLLTAPSVSAIIYSIKRPKYIGYFSIFQLVSVLLLNFILIPRYGAYGPAITMGIINVMLLIYSWVITLNYYRK